MDFVLHNPITIVLAVLFLVSKGVEVYLGKADNENKSEAVDITTRGEFIRLTTRRLASLEVDNEKLSAKDQKNTAVIIELQDKQVVFERQIDKLSEELAALIEKMSTVSHENDDLTAKLSASQLECNSWKTRAQEAEAVNAQLQSILSRLNIQINPLTGEVKK